MKYNDDLHQAIHPDIMPVYKDLRNLAATMPPPASFTGYATIDGKRITCKYYITVIPDGTLREQFEYYQYMYDHYKPITLPS